MANAGDDVKAQLSVYDAATGRTRWAGHSAVMLVSTRMVMWIGRGQRFQGGCFHSNLGMPLGQSSLSVYCTTPFSSIGQHSFVSIYLLQN